ncbi:MAG: diguanylate cyclase [Acidimicrobiales bacterium]|nr:diguanylate cyclase [Acidimicrobiales bacterium]
MDGHPLIDLAPVGLSYSDGAGRVLYANRRWREISGCWDRFPIALERVQALIHPDDRPVAAAALTTLAEGDEATVRIRLADTRDRALALTVRSLDQPMEDGIRFVSTLSDVSELTTVIEELQRSESRFRSVTSALPIGVFRTDRDGTLFWANRRMEEIAGYEIGESTGQSVFRFVHPEDQEVVYTRAQEALLRREPFESTHRMLTRDGTLRWVMARSQPIAAPDGRILEHVGSIEDITELHLRSEGLAHRAAHDPLTGLPNRHSLERITRDLCERSPGRSDIGAVFIDLDDFKAVNDTYGHQAGDHVLVAVAQRVASVIRAEDVVGRYGGDEFVVICPRLTDPAVLTAVAQRVTHAIADTAIVDDAHEYRVGASVGTSLGPGEDTAEQFLHRADLAMYKAKRSGR